MSWKATAAVKALRTGIERSEKFLLLTLADYHNEHTGQCDASVQTLADDCLMTKRSAQLILTSLERKGFIEIQRRRRGSLNLTNQYNLRFENWPTGPTTAHSSEMVSLPLDLGAGVVNGGSLPSERGITTLVNGGSLGDDPGITRTVIEPSIEPKENRNSRAAEPARDGGALEAGVREHLKARLTQQNFSAWINPCAIVAEGDRLIFLAPRPLMVDWLNTRLRPTLDKTAAAFNFASVEARAAV